VNLKELTQVKEFIDDCIECCCQIDECVAEEMAIPEWDSSDDHDAMDGSAVEPHGEGLGTSDVPQDPLAEARVQVERILTNLAEMLDITEPYRKKYDAARIAASGGPKTHLERARMLSQEAIQRQQALPAPSFRKEEADGKKSQTRRVTYKKSKPARS